MSDQSVNSILSTTGGVLFAATLTDGIFRSDDGGKNWSQSNKGLIVRKVWSIEQDKHNVDNFLAGTQYGHLFSFANSGNQWEEVVGLYDAPNRNNWGIDWGFGTTGLTIHTIKSDPNKKDRFYIVASGNGTYRTDDYGKKWKLLKNGLPGSAHNCVIRDCLTNDNSSEPGVYFGTTTGEVYSSMDLGNTWKEIANNLPRIQGVSVLGA